MTDAILAITDGTTRVDLINPSSGFHLISWDPAITDYKGGGVFQNPPLADWRQLRVGKWDTAIEPMELHVNGANPNGAATILQELRQLLEKANQYWTTDWQNTPVWVEARAKCETNTRYAIIVKGRLASDRNYFDQPFTGQIATMQNLPLQIERRAWLANQPGTGTAVEISALEAYDGVNFGNVDDTGTRQPTTAVGEVFVANKRNTANLTNIHLTTAGANRIGAAPPYDIINATGETYFGIDTSVSNSGTFSSLVFDIGTAGVGGPTIVWEYWNGAWVTLDVIDETNDFTDTGINSVTWNLPSDWATTTPGGALPTGYWVRVRITAGSFSTEPQQQNRDVYSVVWPYVEIQSTQVGGDIPALSNITSYLYSFGAASTVQNFSSRLIVGLRSMSRGEDFTAYLNCANEQNPTGLTVNLGLNTTFVTDATSLANSPTGVSSLYNPTGITTNEPVLIFNFSNSISSGRFLSNFTGKYRMFLRVTLSGTANTISVFPRILNAGGQTDGKSVSVASDSVLDLGVIELPGFLLGENDLSDVVELSIVANVTNAATNLYLHDAIIIPIDEWAFDTIDRANGSNTQLLGINYLKINGVNIPKTYVSQLITTSDDLILINWQTVANQYPILQANVKQRLWFFSIKATTVGSSNIESPVETLLSVNIDKNQRYLSLRGEQ